MLANYIKIAFRTLLKHKSYTFINVLGLALGMTCFILIFLFVKFELSYDRMYQQADRTYRVAIERIYPDKSRFWGNTAFPVVPTFKEEFPEVIEGTRIMSNNVAVMISHGDKSITSDRICFADPSFFNVFDIPLLKGDAGSAIARPNTAVLSRSAAIKMFGDEDPMGKRIRVNNLDFMVNGVSEDMAGNSHFHYDFLLSLITIPAVYNGSEWINAWGVYSYIVLDESFRAEQLEAKLERMVKKYMAPEILEEVKTSFEEFVASGNGYRFFLQPLRKIHLHSKLDQELEPNGDITYIYLFSAISIFILFIACINFMNLATARSANRSREVGIRKALGSTRKQLVSQFLLESTILSAVALAASLCLARLLLPLFNRIIARPLVLNLLEPFFFLPLLLSLMVLVGLLAGSYPAFFLSAFLPVRVLKGGPFRGNTNSKLRNGLVIFQFTVSIVLIISTLVVIKQINFMLNKNLGFDKQQVIVIKNSGILGLRAQAFKQELLNHSDIISVSGSVNTPGGALEGNVHKAQGASDDRAVSMSVVFADYDYLKTMGMELIKGRNFSQEYSTDRNAYILNETAVNMLGLGTPLDTRISDNISLYHIIGVVKDFHFKSLHNRISPLLYRGIPAIIPNFISVRIKKGAFSSSISYLKKEWDEMSGNRPFVYTILDEDLAEQYEAEQKTKLISGIFSAIAILIGCLGLFGLAAFTAEQRTKEIGIRKALGASTGGIILMLIKDFSRLISLAFLIGCPLAYLAMENWLKEFAYRTDMSVDLFIIAGALALGISLITVSYQALKVALANPVDSLRYE